MSPLAPLALLTLAACAHAPAPAGAPVPAGAAPALTALYTGDGRGAISPCG